MDSEEKLQEINELILFQECQHLAFNFKKEIGSVTFQTQKKITETLFLLLAIAEFSEE